MEFRPLNIGELTARIPVIQGGMGVGISLSGLAGAVAAQGGVGVISTAQIGYREEGFDQNPVETNLKAIGAEIAKARKIAGEGIIGVNIMVATYRYEDYVKAAVEAGVDLIISGAGLPMTLPELVKGRKTKIAPIVSSLKSVQVIWKYWEKKYSKIPDMVVIEGPKAGGHLGFSYEQLADIDNLNFEEEIKKIIQFVKENATKYATKVPVVVAGGIYDAQDAARVMELGADGVQMGTRFVTTKECDASDAYKNAYVEAKEEDIVIVKSPVGMPGRAINNPFIQEAAKGQIPHGKCRTCVSTCKPMETPYCITEALINAAKGDTQRALLFCGSNAYRATKIETVADIMREFQ